MLLYQPKHLEKYIPSEIKRDGKQIEGRNRDETIYLVEVSIPIVFIRSSYM